MSVEFVSSSSINGLDETFGCELLPLSCVRSIEDRALRFWHVAHEEDQSRDHALMILNRRLRCRHTSIEVYSMHLISAVLAL